MREILAKLPSNSLCVAISNILSDTPAVPYFTGLLRLETKKFYLPYVKTLFHTCISALLIQLYPSCLSMMRLLSMKNVCKKGCSDIANSILYKLLNSAL